MLSKLIRYTHYPLFALTLLSLLLFAAEFFAPTLQYERQAILNGEYWRLFTCHFIHVNAGHLLINVAGAGLLLALFYRSFAPWQWLLALLLATLGIGSGLLILEPELKRYVGFSGVLHSMLVMGIAAKTAQGRRFYLFILLLLALKLALEKLVVPIPLSIQVIGIPVITSANLFGVIGGTLTAYLILYWEKIRATIPLLR